MERMAHRAPRPPGQDSQGKPKVKIRVVLPHTEGAWGLEAGRKGEPSPGCFQRRTDLQPLDFRVLASRTTGEEILLFQSFGLWHFRHP